MRIEPVWSDGQYFLEIRLTRHEAAALRGAINWSHDVIAKSLDKHCKQFAEKGTV